LIIIKFLLKRTNDDDDDDDDDDEAPHCAVFALVLFLRVSDPNILLRILFSKHSVCYFLHMRDQVSHSHKTGTIGFVFLCMFRQATGRQTILNSTAANLMRSLFLRECCFYLLLSPQISELCHIFELFTNSLYYDHTEL
jgi:hypothetical protein